MVFFARNINIMGCFVNANGKEKVQISVTLLSTVRWLFYVLSKSSENNCYFNY